MFTLLFLLCFSLIPAAAQIMSNPAQWYINNPIYSSRVFNGVVATSMLIDETVSLNNTRNFPRRNFREDSENKGARQERKNAKNINWNCFAKN